MVSPTSGPVSEHKGMNGYTMSTKTKVPVVKKKKGWNILSIITRIVVWNLLYSIFFRCPATPDLLTESSPRICKPYFVVSSAVLPIVEPYYDIYAAPYVEVARPYYHSLDKNIVKPATQLGVKYGAPRVAQAKAFGQAQWNKTLQPQVEKYQSVLKGKYDESLAPYLNDAVATASPYYEIAKTNAYQTYYGHILPTYNVVYPYASQGYDLASVFTVETIIPYSKWAWATSAVFLERTVWPQVKILYGENVEPQLVRIRERLGRYRDGKRLQAAFDGVNSSITSSIEVETLSISTSTSLVTSEAETAIESSVEPTSSSVTASVVPEATPLTEEEKRQRAQEIVANDLKTWQEKFAKAADEGSDEISQRIIEITDKMISTQVAHVGNSLVIQLEEGVKNSLEGLKGGIISIIQESEDKKNEQSIELLSAAIRKAGVAVKEKAQAVRTWRQSYDRETNSLVSKASEDTFEILDHISDLGLQEIGMRWAWTDGITHKDWAKYHLLKGKFAEWRQEVEDLITENPDLEKARAASEEVESKAMDIAEDAAKELSRLKEVALWKLAAGDSTDDFNTKLEPPVAKKAAQSIESAASIASENVIEFTEAASSTLIGTEQGTIESITSSIASSASSIAAEVSSSVIGTSQGGIESIGSVIGNSASSIASMVEESASSVAGAVSSAVADSELPVVSSVTAKVAEASSVLSSDISSVVDDASSLSSSHSSLASSLATEASSKVWGGAMAQKVEERHIIFDEPFNEDSIGEKIENVARTAVDKLHEMTKAVNDALMKQTNTENGLAQATGLAFEQYSRAMEAASSALYGAEKGTGEVAASMVSDRYHDAVSAASDIIYGTPTPIASSVFARATDAYNIALSLASDQKASAASLISAQISGTPIPAHEELFSSVEAAYSDSVASASSGLQAAVSAASSLYYGPPLGAFESISSVAASKLSEGLSAASVQFESAKALVGPTPTPAAQKLLLQAQNQYYAGIGMAHARYSDFVTAASSAVMPTQTPFHESIYSKAESVASVASENWEALVTKASTQIYGAPTPYFVTRRMLSEAKEYAAFATDAAVEKYSAIESIIGELITGKEADFTESIYSRLSSAYYTGAVEVVSSASSIASEAYGSASSVAASVFTPPPVVESAYNSAASHISEAVEAGSDRIEEIASTVGSVAETISSHVAEVVEAASEQAHEYAESVGSAAGSASSYVAEAAGAVAEKVEEMASSASSVVGTATARLKDEL